MAKFTPPTREVAEAYAKELGYTSFDYREWHNYYDVRRWCPKGSKRQAKSWEGLVRTFYFKTPEYKEKKLKEAIAKKAAKEKPPEPPIKVATLAERQAIRKKAGLRGTFKMKSAYCGRPKKTKVKAQIIACQKVAEGDER